MIPLHTFNPKVLEGARVALVDPEAPTERWEWIGDTLIAQLTPYKWERIGGIVARLLLDPTDSDTARLIDRRIVGALYPKASGIVDAAMSCDLEQWRIVIVHRNAHGEVVTESVWFSYLPVIAVLSGLPASLANLPEARRRLLCALYPPVAA